MKFIHVVASSRPKIFGKTMLVAAACLALGIGASYAKGGGGTAKPPGGNGGNAVPPPNAATDPVVPPATPINFGGNATPNVSPTTKGFEVTGFFQSATVDTDDSRCPGLPSSQWGGTAVVNGITITIPCNTILQMPANTLSWSDLFLIPTPQAALTLDGTPPSAAPRPTFLYPSTELRVVGNIVNGVHVAGLIYIAQHSLASGNGFITRIDYSTGAIFVGRTFGGPDEVRLVINDQNGRFGRAQALDSRFNVDDQNPTVTSASGYPMCVPRTDPAVADDPLCPQKNRPLGTSPACRTFAQAGIIGVSGNRGTDIMPFTTATRFNPGNPFCSGFVMKYPFGTNPASIHLPPNTAALTLVAGAAGAIAGPDEPDSRQQAPFEVGDFVTYSGVLMKGSADGPNGTDTFSVHTIQANVGIFTAPGSVPVYIQIGEFGMSSDTDANAVTSITGIPQEVQNRLVLEASVTDVTSIVDIYMVDIEPTPSADYPQRFHDANGNIVLAGTPGATPILPGSVTHRWLTPFSMTGEAGAIAASTGQLIDGGITTQLTGPAPGRARIRATKANPGILLSPTRYVRVVARTVCDPGNINSQVPSIINNVPVPGTSVPCVERAVAANGLNTGQYLAPQFAFIFPENVVAGDPNVPFDFWNLGFLVNGEGGSGQSGDPLGAGQLIPTPW